MKLRNFWAKAEQWDERYSKAITHAIELYESPEDLGHVIEKFLGKKNRGAFWSTNPFSKQLWLGAVIEAYIKSHIAQHHNENQAINFSDCVDDAIGTCALATFTHREWCFSDHNIKFDLKKAKQKVRNALVGYDHISVFEVAYYTNENWVTDRVKGRLVSFHCHSLVWFKNGSERSRLGKKIQPRFMPILGNENGARFDVRKAVKDAMKTLRYQSKLPYYGKRTVVDARGKKTQENAKLSYISRYRLFEALKPYTIFDFWLAGGNATQILKDARSIVRKRCPSFRGNCGPDDNYEHLGRRHTRRPRNMHSRPSTTLY